MTSIHTIIPKSDLRIRSLSYIFFQEVYLTKNTILHIYQPLSTYKLTVNKQTSLANSNDKSISPPQSYAISFLFCIDYEHEHSLVLLYSPITFLGFPGRC